MISRPYADAPRLECLFRQPEGSVLLKVNDYAVSHSHQGPEWDSDPHPVRCFDRRRAVNPAPYAKRTRGPKLFAVEAPTKYKPGIDDSKLERKTGV